VIHFPGVISRTVLRTFVYNVRH